MRETFTYDDMNRLTGPYGVFAVVEKQNDAENIHYILKDNLGSWTTITNSSGTVEQRLSYDAWGNQRNPNTWANYTANDTYSKPLFDRGFTGHEHYDRFKVVNANARLYDPVIGRFFSPDPFVQAPDFTQNYNRYSYCMNNPVMFSDPDGELAWFIPIIVGAVVFGTGNLTAHAIRGDVHSLGDGIKYFGQGALVGATLGAAWEFAPLVPYVGNILQTTMSVYGFVQTAVGVTGMVTGAFNGGWKGVGNGAKLFLGNFYLDENNWFGGVAQGISRHTWEVLQTFGGHLYSQIRNTIGNVSRVDYFGGVTFATNENKKYQNGVSLGNYVDINIGGNIGDDFEQTVKNNPIFMHEYGHTIDSRIFGLSYLFAIGIPSLIDAEWGDNHRVFWTEKRANRRAKKYFEKYYNVNWDDYENPDNLFKYYPTY